MGCAEGEKSVYEQEAENRSYKCNISVVLSKAWRSFLIGRLGSVEQLIGHFSIKEVAEFISQLSATPLPLRHAVSSPGSCSQLVCSSKANDNADRLQTGSVCAGVCIIEEPNPR